MAPASAHSELVGRVHRAASTGTGSDGNASTGTASDR